MSARRIALATLVAMTLLQLGSCGFVMFGGYDGTYLSDTWEWDGMSWTQVNVTGPAPRLAAAMAGP